MIGTWEGPLTGLSLGIQIIPQIGLSLGNPIGSLFESPTSGAVLENWSCSILGISDGMLLGTPLGSYFGYEANMCWSS